jgi:hypothetical protein
MTQGRNRARRRAAALAIGIAIIGTSLTAGATTAPAVAAVDPPVNASVRNGELIVVDTPQGATEQRRPLELLFEGADILVGYPPTMGYHFAIASDFERAEEPLAKQGRRVIPGPGCQAERIVQYPVEGGDGFSGVYHVVRCRNVTGAARVFALDGNDRVNLRPRFPSPRQVFVSGGPGDDTIEYISATDAIADGGPGNDTIIVEATRADIHGGPGDDVLQMHWRFSSVPVHTYYGDAGNDRLYGEDSAARLTAHGGDDTDLIEARNATLVANGGNGTDRIVGGPYADVINGDAGNDHLEGQGGKDTIDGGADFDRLYGQGAVDKLIAKDGRADDVVDCGAGPNDREKVVRDPQDPVKRC